MYFCCLEALQNAAKHAGEGAEAMITVWEDEGALLFEVRDAGAGFDLAIARPRGPRLREHGRPGRRHRRQHLGRVGTRTGHRDPRPDPAGRSPRRLTRRRSAPRPRSRVERLGGEVRAANSRGQRRDEGRRRRAPRARPARARQRHHGHRRDALPVGEAPPHEPTEQHADREADHERRARSSVIACTVTVRATSRRRKPSAFRDREIAPAAPDRGEQRVDEHRAGHHPEDGGDRDRKAVDPAEAGEVAAGARPT